MENIFNNSQNKEQLINTLEQILKALKSDAPEQPAAPQKRKILAPIPEPKKQMVLPRPPKQTPPENDIMAPIINSIAIVPNMSEKILKNYIEYLCLKFGQELSKIYNIKDGAKLKSYFNIAIISVISEKDSYNSFLGTRTVELENENIKYIEKLTTEAKKEIERRIQFIIDFAPAEDVLIEKTTKKRTKESFTIITGILRKCTVPEYDENYIKNMCLQCLWDMWYNGKGETHGKSAAGIVFKKLFK